jgi:hypothetical protein
MYRSTALIQASLTQELKTIPTCPKICVWCRQVGTQDTAKTYLNITNFVVTLPTQRRKKEEKKNPAKGEVNTPDRVASID